VTGPLTFLPLHAAGIYGQSTTEHTARAFNRVVSSYTPNLLALSRTVTNTSPAPQSQHILVVSQPSTPGLKPLPGTVAEANNVKAHFDPDQTTHLDDAAATVDAVLQALATHRPSILHLACHGIQDREQPTHSAFMLHDGPLPLAALMTKSTDGAALAFLSACQTATGDEKLPDETVHLAAGMLAVGFRSVVGTMWSIGDDDAALVADEVYARLTELGVGKSGTAAYALHNAIERLRTEVGEDNFLRWIPFVHWGL
jgi:CHAT domain-containing protein